MNEAKEINKRSRITAGAAILLLAGAVIYIAIQAGSFSRLENSLDSERLQGESVLSEKLELEKDLQKLQAELKSLTGKNALIEHQLTNTVEQLQTARAALKISQRQDASISQLRSQNADLIRLRNEIEEQLNFHRKSLAANQATEQDLEQQIAQLKQQNKELSESLNMMTMNSMTAVLTEAVRKSGKLTVKARRTNKLVVNIDVPTAVASLNFRIVDPSGKELTSADGTLTVGNMGIRQKDQSPYASAGSILPSLIYNSVEMVFIPKENLRSGIYTIAVRDDFRTIGSLQVKLR
jgi:hypothetical protein